MKSIYNALTKYFGKRFVVQSMTNPSVKYVIKRLGKHAVCSCPDCQIRNRKCKHIKALESGKYPVGKVYAF